jgi:hypothetical protein
MSSCKTHQQAADTDDAVTNPNVHPAALPLPF